MGFPEFLNRGPGGRTGRAKRIRRPKTWSGKTSPFSADGQGSMERPSVYLQDRPNGLAEVRDIPAPVTVL